MEGCLVFETGQEFHGTVPFLYTEISGEVTADVLAESVGRDKMGIAIVNHNSSLR